MSGSVAGSIELDTTAAEGRKYGAKPGRGNHPANFISYWSALRYCNWLHNGADAGASLQDGAYPLTGSGHVPDNAATVARASDARYFLPSSDEWYKAAYFVNDASLGGLGLWAAYPVGANTINTLAPPGDSQSANLHPGGLALIFARAVGAYAAESPFGARDMAGNLRELVQAPFPGSTLVFTPGGAAGDAPAAAEKAAILGEAMAPDARRADTGFRIAARR
jgi:formylglycine-generating enzyme required for sulfatase activity